MALEKATLTNAVNGRSVRVLFNPEEYTVSRDNNFAQVAVPGLRGPLLQFVAGNMQTLDMELLVDSLLGQEQVVIKSLEANYRRTEHIAGATILGEGSVVLILDVGSLVRAARE